MTSRNLAFEGRNLAFEGPNLAFWRLTSHVTSHGQTSASKDLARSCEVSEVISPMPARTRACARARTRARAYGFRDNARITSLTSHLAGSPSMATPYSARLRPGYENVTSLTSQPGQREARGRNRMQPVQWNDTAVRARARCPVARRVGATVNGDDTACNGVHFPQSGDGSFVRNVRADGRGNSRAARLSLLRVKNQPASMRATSRR